MIPYSHELSVLYEIASLPFETSEREICELVMDKLLRVFSANRCAIIRFSNKKPVKNFTCGFKKGLNVYDIIQKKRNRAFKYALTNGILYAEKKVPFTERQIKYLVILADKLNEILRVLEAKRLRQETKDIKTIFKTIPDPIIIVDAKNNILEVNQKLLDIAQIPKEQILKKRIHQFKIFTAETKQKLQGKRYMDQKEPFEVYSIIDNREKCYEINATKVRFKGQNAYLLVLHDVTKRKEIDRLKSEFISLTSHQLRTPASGIKWLCELLTKNRIGKLKPKQYELLCDINEYNERMIKLINELLDVAIIRNKKIKICKNEFSVLLLIKETIKDNAQLINEKKIKISFNPGLKDVIICGDREKTRQIFENLIDNSIKYCDKKPEIRINWKTNNKNEIEFEVSDNGIGISKTDQDGIFNPFFRAKNVTKFDLTRAGLGLYVVKNIVTALNGRVWFKSEVGKGTTFYFTLPLK